MLPLLVVTRPQPDATLWAQQLQAAGVPSHCLPLMEIGPSRSPAAQAALACALQQLDTYSALMFVSGNAVRYFADQLQTTHRVWPAQARIWTPGPGTTKALLAAGVPLAQIDQPAADAAQFDSESLWAQIQTQVRTGQRVLIVRGGDGQDAAGRGRVWLTEQLQRQGVQVDFAPVYERHPPPMARACCRTLPRCARRMPCGCSAAPNVCNICDGATPPGPGKHTPPWPPIRGLPSKRATRVSAP